MSSLNLEGFIEIYNIPMILNNEMIHLEGWEFQNYDSLYEKLYREVEKDLEGYGVDSHDILERVSEMIYEKEVCQYFLSSEEGARLFMKYTDYPVYYNEKIDAYLVGITHWGMSWDYFPTKAPRPAHLKKEGV